MFTTAERLLLLCSIAVNDAMRAPMALLLGKKDTGKQLADVTETQAGNDPSPKPMREQIREANKAFPLR